MQVPLIGDSYKLQSLNINAQTCINLMPFQGGPGAKTPTIAYLRHGLTLFSDDDDLEHVVRGLATFNKVLYGVVDDTFYEFDGTGSRTERGKLLTSTGRVTLLNNGFQIGVFEDARTGYRNGYTYDLTTHVFERITSASFYGVIYPAYQNGYGVYPVPDSIKFYISEPFEFNAINALDFVKVQGNSEYLIAVISTHQELWFFKERTISIWYETGEELFPFEPRQTLTLQYGCPAPFSIVRMDNSSLFWLGLNDQSQGVVVRVNGYTPQVISSEAVNFAINQYDVIEDAFAFSYEEDGHLFYVLTFPTEDRTWVYDVLTDAWHERRTTLDNQFPYILPTREGRWRPNCYALFNDKHIVGDFESGKLFYIDSDNFTDNGINIRWERAAYHISQDQRFLTYNNMEIIYEGGTADATGAGQNPLLGVQFSKNLGHTFLPQIIYSMGVQGDFNKRILIPACGIAKDMVVRLQGDSPVFTAILGMRVDVTESSY